MAPSEGNRIWIFFFIFTQHLRISLMIKTDAKSAEQIAKAILYFIYLFTISQLLSKSNTSNFGFRENLRG